MANEPLDDGSVDFSRGQDAWHDAGLIADGYYAKGINVTTKGGILSHRPAFVKQALTFTPDALDTKTTRQRSAESIWKSGKFQALIPQPCGNDFYVIVVIAGLIFRVNIDTLAVTLLSQTVRCNQYAMRVNWTVGDDKIYLFDYPDYSIIIDGATVYRGQFGLCPPCALGTFNNNRLIIANDGIAVTAGDPIGTDVGPDIPAGYSLPQDTFIPPQSFAEYVTLSSAYYKQSFTLPSGNAKYPITALGCIPKLDTSMGIGPTYAATEEQVYYLNTGQPRANWQAEDFGAVLLDNMGIAGNRAVVARGSDLIFLTPNFDVHAVTTARNDAKRWGSVPISREVECWLKSNRKELAKYSAVAYHNNRLFFTAQPYYVVAQDLDKQPVMDVAFGGFAVLELANVSSFLADSNPAWAGLWTGINPVDMVIINKRCFCLSKDGEGIYAGNALYELLESEDVDFVDNYRRRVWMRVYTKEYDAKTPYVAKREHSITINLAELGGTIDVSVARKQSHAMDFQFWRDWHTDAPYQWDTLPSDAELNGLQPHNYRPIFLGDPVVNSSSPLTNDSYAAYYASQIRIDILGDVWQFKGVNLRGTAISDAGELQKPAEDVKVLQKEDLSDWYVPEVDLCKQT